MKTLPRALLLWGLGAALAEVIFGWFLFELALKNRSDAWVWLFPCLLFPLLLGVAIVNVIRAKGLELKVLLLKYLTIYLPICSVLVAATVYTTGKWQLMATLIVTLFQIWLPFRVAKKIRLLQQPVSA
jgi:hypothetical protein